MNASFSTDQIQLRDAMRELLARQCTPQVVRGAWSGQRNPELWASMAELGVLGISGPEDCNGLGLGLLDAILIYEESGAAALPAPLVETAAVAIPLLAEAGEKRWAAEIALGRARVALQVDDGYALDADEADVLLALRDDGAHLVTRDDWSVTPARSVDHSRRLFAVSWAEGPALPVSPAQVHAARGRGVVGSAAQLVGLGRRLLDTTVEYVKNRHQFGRPVGSFQAVQHPLANALVDLDFAAPLIYRAAGSLDQGIPEASVHASMAKAFASDAASAAAKAALQAHGAMGYSFEYDLHLWMKRVWCLARSWGDALYHRRRVSDFLDERAS